MGLRKAIEPAILPFFGFYGEIALALVLIFAMVRIFFNRLFIVFALAIGAAPAAAQVSDTLARAQFFDAGSSLRAEDLVSVAWEPSAAQVRLGLQTGTLWLKLARTVPADEALYLYLVHPNVGLVNVFTAPTIPGVASSGETLSARQLQAGKLLLPRAATPQHASYYVQIQSQGLHWIQTNLLTESERAVRQQREWMMLSAQMTFATLAFIAALFQLLHTGRAIYLGLIGVNALFLLYRLNMNGLLIDAWGQSAPDLVALSTALTVAGLAGFVLLVQLIFPQPGPARTWGSVQRFYGVGTLVLAVLAFSPQRGLVMLMAVSLASCVLLETAYCFGRHWYLRKRKGEHLGLADFLVIPYLLVFVSGAMVFFGIFTPQELAVTPPDLRQFNWPVICTLMFLTLVRRHHTEAALQGAALLATGESLRAEVARRVAQQHFMAMLVHEIRAPLTVIELGKRALTQRVLDAEQTAAWAQRMRSATDTIGQIVENCDEVERLEEGALPATVAEVAIAPVLSDTLDRLRHTVPGAAERIHILYTPETTRYASCRGDAHFLGTILRNLLANALKYAPAGSAVLLQCSAVQQGGRACVEFAVHNDQGPSGAPDPVRVFERYYRAPSATQMAGTGLGLWLSQNLARQMHSEIRLALVGPKIVFSFALEQVVF
jgi:two-component system, sensor histidine kinase LadS